MYQIQVRLPNPYDTLYPPVNLVPEPGNMVPSHNQHRYASSEINELYPSCLLCQGYSSFDGHLFMI